MRQIVWKIWIGILASLSLSLAWAAPVAQVVAPPIKGYQEWKQEKILYAMNQGALVRGQITRAQTEGQKKLVESLEKQRLQLDWNLEVARDLSVTDYFVLYLSHQTQADRFHQAAQKMSTKEVAELIEAYANTLGSGPSEMVVKASPALVPVKIRAQAVQGK